MDIMISNKDVPKDVVDFLQSFTSFPITDHIAGGKYVGSTHFIGICSNTMEIGVTQAVYPLHMIEVTTLEEMKRALALQDLVED